MQMKLGEEGGGDWRNELKQQCGGSEEKMVTGAGRKQCD